LPGVGFWLAGKNTLTLMNANASQCANMIDRIESRLLPTKCQARFIAERIESANSTPKIARRSRRCRRAVLQSFRGSRRYRSSISGRSLSLECATRAVALRPVI